GGFDLSTDRAWEKIEDDSGFVSGRSTHADRIATIREVKKKYGQVIDPHTADGVRVAHVNREPRYAMICLETALPVKFDTAIVEALGQHADRPPGLEELEKRPQRCELMQPDAERLKKYITTKV